MKAPRGRGSPRAIGEQTSSLTGAAARPRRAPGQAGCSQPGASRGGAAGLCAGVSGREEERGALTHAVLHHHEATLVAFEALTLKAAGRVDTDPTAAEIGGDPALVDV